jgi:mannose/fructose/N-acetylgalactosamine-specific phosphotransferase system component IIB
MALPSIVALKVVQVERLKPEIEGTRAHTLLLIRDIPNAERIVKTGVIFERLTLGNVHASAERKRLTDAVYLSEAELSILEEMYRAGVEIEIQTFPGEVLRFRPDRERGTRWVKY